MKVLNAIVILTVIIFASACARHPETTTASQPAVQTAASTTTDTKEVALPENFSENYLARINEYAGKLARTSPKRLWKSGTSVGVGFPEMVALPDGRSYELYVDKKNDFGQATFFFRSVDTEKDFPRERVIFTYDYDTKKGSIEYRKYAEKGAGVAASMGEAVVAFEEYLKKADRIIAGT